MSFEEITIKGTEMQAKILEVEKRLNEKKLELSNLDLFKEIQTLEQEKKNEMALYNAFTDSAFGLVDNKQTDVLSIAKAIRKISKLD